MTETLEGLAGRFPWLRDLDPRAEWHICPECGFLADSFDSTAVPWRLGKGCVGALAESRLTGHISEVHPPPLPRGRVPRPRKLFGGKRRQELLYVEYSYRLGSALLDEVMVVDRKAWEWDLVKQYGKEGDPIVNFQLPRGSHVNKVRPVSNPEMPLETGAIRESVRREREADKERKRRERARSRPQEPSKPS